MSYTDPDVSSSRRPCLTLTLMYRQSSSMSDTDPDVSSMSDTDPDVSSDRRPCLTLTLHVSGKECCPYPSIEQSGTVMNTAISTDMSFTAISTDMSFTDRLSVGPSFQCMMSAALSRQSAQRQKPMTCCQSAREGASDGMSSELAQPLLHCVAVVSLL
ncbi:hypothetical protein ACOMHN_056649 [Nucella lapillus]